MTGVEFNLLLATTMAALNHAAPPDLLGPTLGGWQFHPNNNLFGSYRAKIRFSTLTIGGSSSFLVRIFIPPADDTSASSGSPKPAVPL